MAHKKAPVIVLVTGAAGQIGYPLCFHVAKGEALGKDQPVIVHLFDIPLFKEALDGIELELIDGAFPLLAGVVSTVDIKEAFSNVDYAIMVGSMPRKEGMERSDLLKANGKIFKEQGAAFNTYSKKSVKVLVVGNPANTNAMIASKYAPDIPKENFTALTRLDHNRALAQIAKRLHVSVSQVHNVIIWGNHSSTQYPDVNSAYTVINGEKKSVREAINDDNWLNGDFITTVQQRGAHVIKLRKASSAGSAAQAIADHMSNWILGTPEGEIVSMAVPSDGSYGIKEGVIFSYPVTIKDGKYTIVQGLPVGEFSQKKLDLTAAELFDERETALKSFQD